MMLIIYILSDFPVFFSKLSSYNSYSNVVFIKYDIKEVRLASSLFPAKQFPFSKTTTVNHFCIFLKIVYARNSI